MFDYTTLLPTIDTYPGIRIWYDAEESGWARVLDDTHVCIANVPLADALRFYDIVTLDRTGEGLPIVETVVQRYFAQQCGVEYMPEEARDDVDACKVRYVALRAGCVAAGCVVEDMEPGVALLNAPEGVDIPALLETLSNGWS